MMAEEPKSRLGRGLAALIGDAGADNPAPERARAQRKAPVEMLRPNPRNPRTHFSEEELSSLADSIRERGVIQPILVRAVPGGREGFEIIAGERRWRAAQRAGLHAVPIVVVEASDRESLEFAIIENVQRADLNPLEEAAGYERLGDEFNYSADQIAKVVGKSRPHVANALRLLKLDFGVQMLLREGRLSAGHARMLVGRTDAMALADRIVAESLSVRQVEALVRPAEGGERPRVRTAASPPAPKDADTRALENRLVIRLGLKVEIDSQSDRGTLTIHYRTFEQLDEVVRLLESGPPPFEYVDDDKPADTPPAPAGPRIRRL